jgi:O-acetyl-ADP-ribose deacetylase (regulator of RNase III)
MLQSIARELRRMRLTVHKPMGRTDEACLRLLICDKSPPVAREFARAFEGVEAVEVVEGNILNLDCDALVSPANSFGLMDGGLDQAIDRFYEGEAQRAVLSRIAERFYGELPVGTATVIEMRSRRFPFLVVSPTMRVPGNCRGTINAYLAMRAALIAVIYYNQASKAAIGSVAVPGLCTGVGCMSPEDSATQMRAAHDMILGGVWQTIVHPLQAPFAIKSGPGDLTLPTEQTPRDHDLGHCWRLSRASSGSTIQASRTGPAKESST